MQFRLYMIDSCYMNIIHDFQYFQHDRPIYVCLTASSSETVRLQFSLEKCARYNLISWLVFGMV